MASSSSHQTTCTRAVGKKDSKFHFAFGFCGPLVATRSYFHQGSSRQRLEKCLIYTIFYALMMVVLFGRALSRIELPSWARRISMWNFIITMTTPSKAPTASGKPLPPHQICLVSFLTPHGAYCKKNGRFCSKFCREKSISVCMIGGASCGCVVFPPNEHSDDHLSVRQGLLLLLVSRCFY